MSENVIQFSVQVPVKLKRDNAWIIASCPPLDVHSQGRSEDEAINNLVEAIQLFIESCFERGTLEQILKAAGFKPVRYLEEAQSQNRTINVPLSLLAAKNAEARTY